MCETRHLLDFFFFFLVTAAEDDRLCWGKDSCRLCEARFGETVELQLFSLTSAAVHEGRGGNQQDLNVYISKSPLTPPPWRQVQRRTDK